MKKFLVLFAVSLFATAAVAQTEKGSFRIGGTTNFGFASLKSPGDDASENMFDVGLDFDYFIANNWAVGIGGSFSSTYTDGDGMTDFLGAVGCSYYLPIPVFITAGFDLVNTKWSDFEGVWGSGVSFGAGYSAFVSDHIAIEPAAIYRVGLSKQR
jgi:hypothetical protein